MAAHFSYTLTVQLEYTNHLLQFFKLFSYYAGIMLNAFSDLLCSKLCWHNWLVPTHQEACGNYAGIIVSTMSRIIILAVLLAFREHKTSK